MEYESNAPGKNTTLVQTEPKGQWDVLIKVRPN